MDEDFKVIKINRCNYPIPHKHAIRAFEFELVNRVLDLCDGNKTIAADMLGLSRRHLLRIMSRWACLQYLADVDATPELST